MDTTTHTRLIASDRVEGTTVYNPDGEKIGSIDSVMIDKLSGKVAYADMSFGGFLGMGDKLFAVPFNALKLDTVNKRFTLDVEKSRLESAPGFNKDSWPNMADQTWADSIHAWYGTKPYPGDMRI